MKRVAAVACFLLLAGAASAATLKGNFSDVVVGDGVWVDPRADGAVPDDGLDDSTALLAAISRANGREVRLSAGTWRLDAALVRSLSAPGVGLKLTGAGIDKTILDTRVANGAAIQIGVSSAGSYQYGGWIRDLTIQTGGAPAAASGISVAGWWWGTIERVKIKGLSGDGVVFPLLTGLSSNPDDYQTLQVRIRQCQVDGMGGWGVNGAGGHSAAGVALDGNHIVNCAGGGVYLAAQNMRITGNAISGNGSSSGAGLVIDNVHANPNGVLIEDNEFDGNYSYDVWLKSAAGGRLWGNRLLSREAAGAQRPAVHVRYGDAGKSVLSVSVGENYHRSAGANNYAVTGHEFTSTAQHVRLWNNYFPAADNSTNLTKYSGWNINYPVEVVENSKLAYGASVVPTFSSRITAAQTVSSSQDALLYADEEFDLDGYHDAATGQFTAPYQGLYWVDVGVTISGLSEGQQVRLYVKNQSGVLRQAYRRAGGLTDETFTLSCAVYAAKGDTIFVAADQNSGSDKSIKAGVQYNWFTAHAVQ